MKTANQTTIDRVPTANPTSPRGKALKLKRILVPIDFSEASLKALRYAIPFAEESGATLYLVHVVEPASFMNDLANVPLAMRDQTVAACARERLISVAQNEIEELVPVYPQVRIGKAYQEIAILAKNLNVDLIIIATQGHTGLKHAFLGSTAERVVRHAGCPVLVVRQRERDFI